MGKIMMGQGKDAITLTNEIADEKRQAFGYNMLYYMADNGATITVDGKDLPLDKDELYVISQDGGVMNLTKPDLDPEWFGPDKEGGHKPENFTISNMCRDYSVVNFGPETSSYEKGCDMFNFMIQGIDKSVTINYPQDDDMKQIVINGRPVHLGMTKGDGEFCTERFNRDWFKETLPEDDFSAAVASIPETGSELGR